MQSSAKKNNDALNIWENLAERYNFRKTLAGNYTVQVEQVEH